jgi:AraC-like DNA-binding protein
MIGARFRPGGAYPFLNLPLSELNDSVVEMELVWGEAMVGLRERLLAAPSVDGRFRVLQQTLLHRAAGRLEPDRSLSYALCRLKCATEETTIRGLADEIGVAQKRLVRTFQKHVGLKPKTLARIFRFQGVLRRLELDSRVSWAYLAQEAGYFDQSHFIRDFQSLSGLNPSRYLIDKGEYLNFIPLR